MTRRVLKILTLMLPALLLVAACSETTRYRVLHFFFDGVPQPGAEHEAADGSGLKAAVQEEDASAATAEVPADNRPRMYVHTPFRERNCSGCHDMFRGKLVQGNGLCMRCHQDIRDENPYVHGPVAVGACRECHHFHQSPHPNILLSEAKDLCLRCHPAKDLLQGEHHMTVESASEGSCIECHNPHGGRDRLFLKPSEL